MLAQSEPPREEEKVGVVKCCSRFVSFHLLPNESCYCCKRQPDLTGEFKVKTQGVGKGAFQGGQEGGRLKERQMKRTSRRQEEEEKNPTRWQALT